MNKREWMLHAALTVIGAGREFDVDDIGATLSETYDAIVAASPEQADSGWIEHRGEKPYPEGYVEIRLRNGDTFREDADDLLWDHTDLERDIIAWRPAT